MSEVFDFYYSENAEHRMQEYAEIRGETCIVGRFNGQKFVECVKQGQNPVMLDDDLIMVGCGTLGECSFN